MAAGAAIVVVAALWLAWPSVDPADIDLVGDIEPAVPAELVLDADAAAQFAHTVRVDPLIVAKQIRVVGIVALSREHVLITNELLFDRDAVLRTDGAPVTVIASLARGVRLDASGAKGSNGSTAGKAGKAGATGGSVLFAAGVLDDVRIDASGGAGGDGQGGAAGARGQNGFCGPRGFRLAERGKPGRDGGASGSGGSGGLIKLLSPDSRAELDVTGGSPGREGRGGTGGQGGAGCRGVRGNQDQQPPGDDGASGLGGRAGEEGLRDPRRVEFTDVADAVAGWLVTDARSPIDLRDRLLSVSTLEPEE